MSEMSARARRRAFCLGSCTMNGLIGRSGPVLRLTGVLTPAAGAAAGGAGGAGRGRGGGAGAGGGGGGVAVAGGRASGGATGIAGRPIGRAGAAGGAGGAGGAIAGRGGGGAAGTARAAGGGGGGAGARGGAGGGADATGVAAAPAPSGLTANTLLQTLQRARRPLAGTFAGSTRYTVSHDGHVTFTLRSLRFLRLPDPGRGGDRRQRPIPPASLRSSSFPSPAR